VPYSLLAMSDDKIVQCQGCKNLCEPTKGWIKTGVGDCCAEKGKAK